MIKVLHVGQTEKSGGKYSTARVLHGALPYLGVASYLAVVELDNGAHHYGTVRIFRENIQEKFNLDHVSDAFKNLLASVDIVHLHTTADLVVGMLFRLFIGMQIQPKVVWSIHDASAYTGGCYFSAVCEKWQNGCLDCPLVADNENLAKQKSEVVKLKQATYSKLAFITIINSRWQGGQLADGILKGKAKALLPALVDKTYFYVGDKKASRLELGLPVDATILLCEAAGKDAFVELYKAMRAFIDRLIPVVVVCFDGDSPDAVRSLVAPTPEVRGAYYRAADLYVDLRESGFYYETLDARACGCPSLVLNRGAATEFLTRNTGFVIAELDGKHIFNILKNIVDAEGYLAGYSERCKDLAEKANKTIEHVNRYLNFYQQYLQQSKLEQVSIEEAVDSTLFKGDSKVLKPQLEQILELVPVSEVYRRDVIIDRFCLACIKGKDFLVDKYYLWDVISLWMNKRSTIDLKTMMRIDNEGHYTEYVSLMRRALVAWFTTYDNQVFAQIECRYINDIGRLWRDLFLNSKSILQLLNEAVPDFSAYPANLGYPYVCLQSMFVPYYQGEIRWGAEAAVKSPIKSLFLILTMWLVQVPLYRATVKEQQQSSGYLCSLTKAMIDDAGHLTASECRFLSTVFMGVLWQLSYIGGNIIEASRAYGDFLQMIVKQFYPAFSQAVKPNRKLKKQGKIRIGYMSLRFRHQAVSLYMGNRMMRHDKSKFHVTCMSFTKDKDYLTKQIANSCDEFVDLTPLSDSEDFFTEMAKVIKKQKFDILIYPDIGMDEVTFLLGAMRLAPVQVVMMGHCMTSGLSTIDYYVSGDHEPVNGQDYYVEKLIKLPNLGVCQLPPVKNVSNLTRSSIGVPDDAILFVSCANGLKHGDSRNHLLIDILKAMDNAYLVMKPFQDFRSIDERYTKHLQTIFNDAGVGDRLVVLDPFPSAGDLMGLLCLADVQLDTYPFGGWTTNLEALYYHLPIVTQIGDLARSRWGAKMLEALGVQEGIARNEAEYVAWAIKLGRDGKLRAKVRKQIADHVEKVLFNPQSGQVEFENFLQSIAKFS